MKRRTTIKTGKSTIMIEQAEQPSVCFETGNDQSVVFKQNEGNLYMEEDEDEEEEELKNSNI